MKRVAKIIGLAIIVAFVLGGAAAHADNKEILKYAGPVINQLTKAMETCNYNMYVKPWSPGLNIRKKISKEDFKKACQINNNKLGKLEKKKLYNVVKKNGFTIVQWTAKFEKAPKGLYLRLVLKKEDGKYQVHGHWVKPNAIE